jgi:hypothetical protein
MHGFKDFAAAVFTIQSAVGSCHGNRWETRRGRTEKFCFVVDKAWRVKVDFLGLTCEKTRIKHSQQFFFIESPDCFGRKTWHIFQSKNSLSRLIV